MKTGLIILTVLVLIVLFGGSGRVKELEILVLRHELVGRARQRR